MFASRRSGPRAARLGRRGTAALALVTALGAIIVSVLPAGSADTPVGAAAGAVTGRVFQDFNSNGVRDTTVAQGRAIDSGVGGIVVRAFDSTGAEVAQTTTAADGTYSLNVASAGTAMLRIEFGIPSTDPALAGLLPSFATSTGASGSGVGTTVQFAKSGDVNVDLGVNRPGEYCQNNPLLVSCVFPKGTGDGDAGAFTLPTAMPTFALISPSSRQIGSSDALGSVFGAGTDRSRNVFYGTYVKRHAEYGDAGATNTIYRINIDNPNVVTQFVTLPGVLPAHDPTAAIGGVPYSGDTGVFTSVGRIGLGDVDVTSDGSTLLAVDMDETAPKLFFVPILGSGDAVTAGTYTSAPIPAPATFNGVACPGIWHPMGIGVRGERILVGGVCGAEDTVSSATPNGPDPTQSTAFVLEWTGSGFTTVFAMPLTYERGCTYTEVGICSDATTTVGSTLSADWGAWNEYPIYFQRPTGGALIATNAQAMLANIEIADNGDLLLSFRARYADQMLIGNAAWTQAYTDSFPDPPEPYPEYVSNSFGGGDMLRVCRSAGAYALESNGTCPGLAGSGYTDLSGGKEFYFDNYRAHSETITGAAATMPGYPGVWSTVYDVVSLGEQGVLSYGTCAAATTPANCVPTPGATDYGSKIGGYGFGSLGFSKGQGLADIEVMCDQAPVQVGDRVWVDADRDGVQDAGEVPVAGVMVRLYDSAGVLVGTAVTDADGQYLFSSNVSESAAGEDGSPDASGGGLRVGEGFTIRFDDPADYAPGGPLNGYEITSANAVSSVVSDVDDAIDSDATVDDTVGVGVTVFPSIVVPPLSPGGNDHSFDMGVVTVVAVGDRVWVDPDGDGVQDVGEVGLAGVSVSLVLADGVTPAMDVFGNPAVAVTDADGNWVIDNLAPGDYRALFSLPEDYIFTVQGAGAAGTDSDPDAAGLTSVFSLSASSGGGMVVDTDAGTRAAFVNPLIDAGVVPMVSVGDLVWFDADHDGVQDADESGIAGVVVSITTADGSPVFDVFGNPVTSTVTDEFGNYEFDELPVGRYRVSVVTPEGMFATVTNAGTSETDSSTDTAVSVDLQTAGAADLSLDFGFWAPPAAVGNYVWFDADRDGIQDPDEAGVEGVTLTLTTLDGGPVVDTLGRPVPPVTTDANGFYLFDELPIGQAYVVTITYPDGFAPTVAGAGSDDGRDSSTDTATSVVLTGDIPFDLGLDFGLVPAEVSVGDHVWFDTDRDGIQDPDEAGIAGVTLTLTTIDGDPVLDVDGNPVGPTVTDADGFYLFDRLPVGQYTVTVTPPAGMVPTTADAGNDPAQDSSTDAATSADLQHDGAADLTLDFGFVPARVSVGDLVWFDLNHDGIQDDGEPGLAGVELSITTIDGAPVFDTDGNPVGPTWTDANGFYLFTNLPLGRYIVTVTPPAGMAPTLAGSGSDPAQDSSTGTATSTVLDTDAASDLTLDFGFWVPPAVIGSTVFHDLDHDGIQDPGEPGVPGVTITLTNPDGDPVTDNDGNPVPPAITDANGFYLFSNLPLDTTYQTTITYPAGYTNTLANIGDDPALDSTTGTATSTLLTADNPIDLTLDFGIVPLVAVGDHVWIDTNRNGTQDPDEPPIANITVELYTTTGTLLATTTTDTNGFYVFDNLTPGTYQIRFTPPDGHTLTTPTTGNPTADSNPDPTTGWTPPFTINPTPTGDTTTTPPNLDITAPLINPTIDAGLIPITHITGRTWIDTNRNGIDEPDEPPLPGVTIELLNTDGTPALDPWGNPYAPAITDTNGNYRFNNITPGTYQIRSTPPPGWDYTLNSTQLSNPITITPTMVGTNATQPAINTGYTTTLDQLPTAGTTPTTPLLTALGTLTIGLTGWLLTRRRARRHA